VIAAWALAVVLAAPPADEEACFASLDAATARVEQLEAQLRDLRRRLTQAPEQHAEQSARGRLLCQPGLLRQLILLRRGRLTNQPEVSRRAQHLPRR
jgi:hypothetical protein